MDADEHRAFVSLHRAAPASEVTPLARLAQAAKDIDDAVDTRAVVAAIHDVVAFLLNDVVITCINNTAAATTAAAAAPVVTQFRIAEIEAYVTVPHHNDPFSHVDPLQREAGVFYFHRKGGTFKGGSFKGMDITFGSQKSPCGMLIRSIVEVKPSNGTGAAPVPTSAANLVDGPCLVVDRLLQCTGSPSIVALVQDPAGRLTVESPRLRLTRVPADSRTARIGAGAVALAPRVGLIPRESSAVVWSGALLRFVAPDVAALMKHRGGLVAGALAVYRLRLGSSAAFSALSSAVITAMIKSAFGTRFDGEASTWTDAPVDGYTPGDATSKTEDGEILKSTKLNSAPGAAGVVLAAMRRGALLHAIPWPKAASQ